MKLVAAAKVRRAQDAVVNGRPFSEALVKVMPQFCCLERAGAGLLARRGAAGLLVAVLGGTPL